MDLDTAETKVQVSLSTRDANLQIEDGPVTLFVSTGKLEFSTSQKSLVRALCCQCPNASFQR